MVMRTAAIVLAIYFGVGLGAGLLWVALVAIVRRRIVREFRAQLDALPTAKR